MNHPHHSRWLAQNSPYRPHTVKKQQFSQSLCCGAPPEPTGLEICVQSPPERYVWLPVYQCRTCGKRYLWWDDKGKQLYGLLKYKVRKQYQE